MAEKKCEKQLLAVGETPTFHIQSVLTSMISYGPSAPPRVPVFGIVLHTNKHRKPSEISHQLINTRAALLLTLQSTMMLQSTVMLLHQSSGLVFHSDG